MVKELLDITTLWTLDDLKDMIGLCKQAKWAEGISIILQSKAMHRKYLAMHNVDQNAFLHQMIVIPYEILDSNDFEMAQLDDDDRFLPVVKAQRNSLKQMQIKQPQEGERPSKMRFNHKPWDLTDIEKYDLKVAICKELSRSPYAAGFSLLPFIDPPTATFESLTRLSKVADDVLYDMIEYAITCNENISDWELHDFIIASQGMLPKLLHDGLWGLQRRYEKFKIDNDETQEYVDEIDFLIQRTLHHPTMAHYEDIAKQVRQEYEDLLNGKTPMTGDVPEPQAQQEEPKLLDPNNRNPPS
jgi:hypothetical protein